MTDPRNNLINVLAVMEHLLQPVTSNRLAVAMGAPRWQMMCALNHLRAQGKVEAANRQGWWICNNEASLTRH